MLRVLSGDLFFGSVTVGLLRHRATMCQSKNFGAPIGQSQQLMFTVDPPCGAAIAKLLSGGPRQSN